MIHLRPWARCAAAAAVLLLAGCGGGSTAPVSAGPTASDASSVTMAPSSVTSVPVPPPISATGTQMASVVQPTTVSIPPGPRPPTRSAEVTGSPAVSDPQRAAVVQAIRAADQGRLDRVVIQFAGSFGAYRVAYVDQVTEDPTGDPVPLAGSAFLQVSVQNATFDNAFQAGGNVPALKYQGSRDLTFSNLSAVKEIKDAGDFEAVITLGIGVARTAGFRAYRLENPARLVIEIAH